MSERIPMIPPYKVISRVQILAETKDYNHELMNIPAMWKKTRGALTDGTGIPVVILDSGVPNHVDLKPSGGRSFIPGYEEDQNGHSTHCGGIIAAVANNGMGVAGIAPDCADYYGAVLDKNGSGDIQQICDGIRWAVDEIGARVISMSLGIPAGYATFKKMEEAVNYATSHGVAVICAAGNEAGGVGQPACYESAIAVAAVNDKKQHARFSNSGPEVDFASGGVNVYSTYLKNGYAKLSGTSMACPALAGVATLIIADEKNDTGKWLTPAELVEKMKRIAFDVGDDGFDETFGHGIPVFRSGKGEPDEPEQPGEPDEPETPEEPEKPTDPADPGKIKKNNFPCGLTWKVLSAFSESADRAARNGADPDGAILAGLQAVGEFATKATEARRQ